MVYREMVPFRPPGNGTTEGEAGAECAVAATLVSVLDVLPKGYWLVAAAVPISFVAMVLLNMEVAKRRRKYGVPYPNMYATTITVNDETYSSTMDGKPESAVEFNNAQRAAQQPLETYNGIVAMTMLSGLKHPIVAGACLFIWTCGTVIYAGNYAKLGASKRNAGFATIKYIGLLGLLGTSFSLSASLAFAAASSPSSS